METSSYFIYSSTTNQMQRYTIVFITIDALHVSGGSSAHHQELKSVTQHPVFVDLFLLLTAIVSELELIARQIPDAVYTVLSS